MKTASSHRRTPAALAAAACVLLALAGAHAAPADSVVPPITLGPTAVVNGIAIVTGSVTTPSPATAGVSINGQPLGLNATGRFTGVANLAGKSELAITVQDTTTGDTSTVSIPLTANLVGPGGVVSPDALAAIQAAAVSIAKPVGGFVSDPGTITVEGAAGKANELAGLAVNGVETLSSVAPNGTFAVPVPGTSREIGVLMTDQQGVSLETRYRTVAVTSVSAQDATGVRIASIRYFAKAVKQTKRIRMVVTVKDRRALVVRGARVTVRSAQTGRLIGGAKLKKTNRSGQAGFVLHLRRRAFGKRLVVVTTAKTPKAQAVKRSSVRLPRLARRG
jgi:hypothetical protein